MALMRKRSKYAASRGDWITITRRHHTHCTFCCSVYSPLKRPCLFSGYIPITSFPAQEIACLPSFQSFAVSWYVLLRNLMHCISAAALEKPHASSIAKVVHLCRGSKRENELGVSSRGGDFVWFDACPPEEQASGSRSVQTRRSQPAKILVLQKGRAATAGSITRWHALPSRRALPNLRRRWSNFRRSSFNSRCKLLEDVSFWKIIACSVI